jgi:predicted murein hydrolase (TIGR00659 family)
MLWTNPLLQGTFWSLATIALYLLNRIFYRRFTRWWTSPLLITPILLIVISVLFNVTYKNYIRGTHWLLSLLNAVIVAFAIPIYDQRKLILRNWAVLLIGMLVGSLTSVGSTWIFSSIFGLKESLKLSLLPRSISTPFAMAVSSNIGGIPELTAVFVVCTGVFGAAIGEGILYWLPLRSAVARGALFGMGAHGAGVAKAHEIGQEEGSIAGLVMVFVGLTNVLVAPLVIYLVKYHTFQLLHH